MWNKKNKLKTLQKKKLKHYRIQNRKYGLLIYNNYFIGTCRA